MAATNEPTPNHTKKNVAVVNSNMKNTTAMTIHIKISISITFNYCKYNFNCLTYKDCH